MLQNNIPCASEPFRKLFPFGLLEFVQLFFPLGQVKATASIALHEAQKLIFLNRLEAYLGESNLLAGGPIQSELSPSAGQTTAQLFSLLDPAVLGNAQAEWGCLNHSLISLPSHCVGRAQGGAGHSLLCRII